jgi:hypothetical protein
VANCIAEGGHIAGCCQHFDQNICLIINLPAGHRLEADIVEGGIAGEGIAEVVLHRSIVGSTSWRSDDSCYCQWCSIWGGCVCEWDTRNGVVGLTRR